MYGRAMPTLMIRTRPQVGEDPLLHTAIGWFMRAVPSAELPLKDLATHLGLDVDHRCDETRRPGGSRCLVAKALRLCRVLAFNGFLTLARAVPGPAK